MILHEGMGQNLLGLGVDVLDVPGHCPGSLCFHLPEEGLLIGGDVLFRGGIGRWDLPGGNGELLLQGIRSKVMPLPDQTVVLPGHGPSTTIGVEKATNPFLRR
jgi:glyoxylase-like metal-dependent hydrolase (beta-lactamase superfamily II)